MVVVLVVGVIIVVVVVADSQIEYHSLLQGELRHLKPEDPVDITTPQRQEAAC